MMPLPTPDELQQHAVEVAAAQEHLAKVQAWLEEGQRLLDPAGQPPAPAALPAVPTPAVEAIRGRPAARAPKRVARTERVPHAPKQRDVEAAILAYLLDHRNGVTTVELEKNIDASRPTLTKVLRILRESGRVRSEGKTANRRHYPAAQEPHSEQGERVKAAVERVETTLTTNVEKLGLRDRVLKAILADPDALDPDKIAWAVDEHLERVELVLQELVVRGQLIENRDGTYGRGRRAGVAA